MKNSFKRYHLLCTTSSSKRVFQNCYHLIPLELEPSSQQSQEGMNTVWTEYDGTPNEKFPLIHWNSAQLKFHHIRFILYITKKRFFRILLCEFSNNGPMKFEKFTFKKIQDQASILKHKTNLAVNTLTIPYGQWWGRVKWLMGYWQVKLYQSQVNLLKKKFFDFETNPVRVDKSGLHRKKSTFRLFSLAAYDSPLKKTRKNQKTLGGTCQKKRTRMKPFRSDF